MTTLAPGGDCLADAVLRAQPELAGPVASDPVVSRLVTALAAWLRAAPAQPAQPDAVQRHVQKRRRLRTAVSGRL